MSWFKREKENITTEESERGKIPAGLWVKCDQCAEIIYRKEVEALGMVCPKCSYHFSDSAGGPAGCPCSRTQISSTCFAIFSRMTPWGFPQPSSTVIN